MNDSPKPESLNASAESLRRFVVLEHDFPDRHWDLLIESGVVLHSWRLSQRPAAGRRIAATRIADHRRKYLDYEGPISGDRGSVIRVCRGRMLKDSTVENYRLFETTVAHTCRLEVSSDDTCWWVFE